MVEVNAVVAVTVDVAAMTVGVLGGVVGVEAGKLVEVAGAGG